MAGGGWWLVAGGRGLGHRGVESVLVLDLYGVGPRDIDGAIRLAVTKAADALRGGSLT